MDKKTLPADFQVFQAGNGSGYLFYFISAAAYQLKRQTGSLTNADTRQDRENFNKFFNRFGQHANVIKIYESM